MQRDRNLLEAAESEGKLTTVRQASGHQNGWFDWWESYSISKSSGRAQKTLQIQCSPHPHPQGGESTILRVTAMKKSENEMIKTGKQGKH